MPWPTANADAMHSFGAGVFYRPYVTDPSTVAAAPALGTELTAPWVEIGQLVNASAPERGVGDTKVTHTKSTSKANEYIPGWVEAGQCTLRLHYNVATYFALTQIAPLATATAPDWDRYTFGIQLPDGGVLVWNGFLKGMPVTVPGADSDDPVAVDVTIRVSGDIYFDSPS